MTKESRKGNYYTRIVNVALSCDTGVALGLVMGIWRDVLCWTVARKRN